MCYNLFRYAAGLCRRPIGAVGAQDCGGNGTMEENRDYDTIDLLELLGVLRQHILALVLATV